ncbi:ECF family RNA polymerase sigma factor SbrI [soil metagenome]
MDDAGANAQAGESDAALAIRARKDSDAVGQLYWRCANPIFQYCYRATGNRAIAEDLTSTIFLTVVDKIDRFHGGSFRSWLFTIARHAVIDRARTEQRLVPMPVGHDPADPAHSPEAIVLANDDALTVRELLGVLSEEQREVVQLHLAGLNAAEIADVLGKRHDAIRALQSRALVRLKTFVRENAIQWSAL